jgi:hypothetical protein
MTTTVAPPAAALTLSGLAPSLLQSCILAPTPAVPPTIGDNDIYTPVAPGVTYAALPTVTIVDTSPTQVIGCANDVGPTPQQTLNALFPAAITGDGVVDRATNDFWVYDGTTWNNVGPNPGPTIVDATIIPPWNEILSYDATVRTRLQIQSLDYALALLTEPDPIGVVLGLDARRVRIVAAPALTFTLAPQTPHVSAGARVGVPALALQLTQHAPLILTSLPAANLTLAANAPAVSAGVAIAAPPTGIALVAEPPQRAGPRPTTVSAPLAGLSVSPTAPTVATGASVSPTAFAIEISAVAPDVVASSFDADAAAYIAAVEAADAQTLEPEVKTAYNDFVVGCKSDGIWNAIKASCILAGARTLTGALTPLVGTAPTNFNFVSGDYNRKTGLVGNGSTKYLDSNRNNNADPQNNQHMIIYIHAAATSALGSFPVYIGAGGDTNGTTHFGRDQNNGQLFTRNRSATFDLLGGGSDVGFIGQTRLSSSEFTFRRLNMNNSYSRTSQAPLNGNVYVYNTNISGSPSSDSYSNARLAFYSIGEALDLALLDTRVSTLISAIDAAVA